MQFADVPVRSAQYCIPREFDGTCMLNIMVDLMVMVRPARKACDCPGAFDGMYCTCSRLQTALPRSQAACLMLWVGMLCLTCLHVAPGLRQMCGAKECDLLMYCAQMYGCCRQGRNM